MDQTQQNKSYATTQVVGTYYSDRNLVKLAINSNRKFVMSFSNKITVDAKTMYDFQNSHIVSMDWEDFTRFTVATCNLVNIDACKARGMRAPNYDSMCVPLIAKSTMQQFGTIRIEKVNNVYRMTVTTMKDSVITESKFDFRPTDINKEMMKYGNGGEITETVGLQNLTFYDFARTLKNSCEYGQMSLSLQNGIKYSGGGTSRMNQQPQRGQYQQQYNRPQNVDTETTDWNNDDIPF